MALADKSACGAVLFSAGEIHGVSIAAWAVALGVDRPLETLRCDGAEGRFLIRSPVCPDVLLID